MIVVGPEDPFVQGIFDFFKEDAATQHIAAIGFQNVGSGERFEKSKSFFEDYL